RRGSLPNPSNPRISPMSAVDPEEIGSREVAPRSATPSLAVGIAPARGAEPGLPALSSTPDLHGLARALWRPLPVALGAGLVSALLAGAVAWSVLPPAHYTTRATLLVAMNRPKIIFETAEVGADYKTFQRTQLALLKSHSVLYAVLDDEEVAKL